jgi:hypothetical protein
LKDGSKAYFEKPKHEMVLYPVSGSTSNTAVSGLLEKLSAICGSDLNEAKNE